MHTDAMESRLRSLLLALALVVLASCGSQAGDTDSADCIATTPASMVPAGDPDTIIEDIIEVLTGERQTDDVPVEEKIDDPNFGGVWGDFQGGVVVAVLDCSKVDPNQLAEMAGGSDYLRLVEVAYTFQETEEFREALGSDLRSFGIEGDVSVEATTSGRKIEVHVLDAGSVPDSFGSEVPDDAYEIIETKTVGTIEG